MFKNINGITVKELKEFINAIPDEDNNGDAYGVWIETSKGISNVAVKLDKLNLNSSGSDLLISIGV